MSKAPKNETALDKVLVAFEAAKHKLAEIRSTVNETRSTLNEIADAVRLAVREQKNQRSELASARALLSKIQAVKL